MNKKHIAITSLLIIVTVLLLYLNNEHPIANLNAITPHEVKQKMDEEHSMVILDVRTKEEYLSGHVPNSILLPVDEIRDNIQEIVPNKDQEIIVYCRTGNRSQSAMKILIEMGYKNSYDLGGIVDWPFDITNNEISKCPLQ